MPAGNFTLFRANIDDLRMNDLLGAVVKVMLVTSTYVPNAANNGHSVKVDIGANEIAAGSGYTAGGYTLATDTVNLITNGWNYDSEDPTWTASGGSIPAWRYAVVYVAGALWGKTDPLIGYFVGDNTPADVPATTAGNPLTIVVNAAGWFGVTQA